MQVLLGQGKTRSEWTMSWKKKIRFLILCCAFFKLWIYCLVCLIAVHITIKSKTTFLLGFTVMLHIHVKSERERMVKAWAKHLKYFFCHCYWVLLALCGLISVFQVSICKYASFLSNFFLCLGLLDERSLSRGLVVSNMLGAAAIKEWL